MHGYESDRRFVTPQDVAFSDSVKRSISMRTAVLAWEVQNPCLRPILLCMQESCAIGTNERRVSSRIESGQELLEVLT